MGAGVLYLSSERQWKHILCLDEMQVSACFQKAEPKVKKIQTIIRERCKSDNRDSEHFKLKCVTTTKFTFVAKLGNLMQVKVQAGNPGEGNVSR